MNLVISHTKFILLFIEAMAELEVDDDKVVYLIIHRHNVNEVFFLGVQYNFPGFKVELVCLDKLEIVQASHHELFKM